MNYATANDMVERFGESVMIGLTDLTHAGVVDTAKAELALEDATAEIDGYLGRYQLPLNPVPKILRVYACDIARYRLATGMRQTNDDLLSRYEAAISYLKLVAKGVASLGGLPAGEDLSTDNSVQITDPQEKVFGRGNAY